MINILLDSALTSENNEQLEAIIHSIKSGNRKRIEPDSNVILLSDSSDSDDMDL